MKNSRNTNKAEKTIKPASLWQITKSTLAAALGVQTDKNRKADFTGQSPIPYILAGIVFTFIFITSIIVFVYTVVL